MTSKEDRERKLKEIQEVAEGWGKMIAREAFPDGPGLDVTLADMEEYAVAASRALVKGAVESMTAAQGGATGRRGSLPDLWQDVPPEEEIEAGGRAGWRSPSGGTGGPLPDMSPGFFPSAFGIEVGWSRVQPDDSASLDHQPPNFSVLAKMPSTRPR